MNYSNAGRKNGPTSYAVTSIGMTSIAIYMIQKLSAIKYGGRPDGRYSKYLVSYTNKYSVAWHESVHFTDNGAVNGTQQLNS